MFKLLAALDLFLYFKMFPFRDLFLLYKEKLSVISVGTVYWCQMSSAISCLKIFPFHFVLFCFEKVNFKQLFLLPV